MRKRYALHSRRPASAALVKIADLSTLNDYLRSPKWQSLMLPQPFGCQVKTCYPIASKGCWLSNAFTWRKRRNAGGTRLLQLNRAWLKARARNRG